MTATVILAFISWSTFLTVFIWKMARNYERAASLKVGADNLAAINKAHKEIDDEKNNHGDGGGHPVTPADVEQLRNNWRKN
jgi:hypothetical protein